LIVDIGSQLYYCAETQKYCMPNITFNAVTLLLNFDCIIVFLYIFRGMLHQGRSQDLYEEIRSRGSAEAV